MKLYLYFPTGRHSFGSAIIAANNQEEADALAAQTSYSVSFHSILDAVYADGEPRIVEDSVGEE
jgi:hypothetical protein